MGNKVAIILAGCGHADGSEITEAVLSNLALRNQGLQTEFFSINVPQLYVLDHLNKEVLNESRNVMVESARLARGQVKDLSECDMSQFDALVIPGGYGVAKNLCDFASKGAAATVQPHLEVLITKAFEARKPIMAVCIAPALVGIVAHKLGLQLKMTLGNDGNDAAVAMKSLDHNVESRWPHEFVADSKNFFISTPAYMHDTQPEILWNGINLASAHLAGWLKSR